MVNVRMQNDVKLPLEQRRKWVANWVNRINTIITELHHHLQLQKWHRRFVASASRGRIPSTVFGCDNGNWKGLHDEHRPNRFLRASENSAPRNRTLQRRPEHTFPLIAGRRWDCHSIDTTIGRIKDSIYERQAGWICKFMGNRFAHGQIGTVRLFQRLRAGIRAIGTTHCDHIDVARTVAY